MDAESRVAPVRELAQPSSAALTGCMCALTTEDALCSALTGNMRMCMCLLCVCMRLVCVCVCVCVCALEPDSRRMGATGQRKSCTVACVRRGGGGRWEDGGNRV